MLFLNRYFFGFLIFFSFYTEISVTNQHCGKVSKRTNFIRQGQIVTHVWPWMGSLGFWNKDNSWSHQCGASLVSTYQAVTAAHCSLALLQEISEGKLLVRFGDTNITSEHTHNSQFSLVQSMTVHPGYLGHFNHDLSIITFSSKTQVILSDFVSPLCLPEKVTEREDLDGKGLVITGWGDAVANKGILSKLIVKVYNNKVCTKAYSNLRNQDRKQFISDIFCTGDFTGRFTGSTCKGDSGGPVITFDEQLNQYYQIGLVSGGGKFCNGDLPNVFVRMDDESNLSWIQKDLDKTFKYSNGHEFSNWTPTYNCDGVMCEWKRRCLSCSGSGCGPCMNKEEKCKKCRNNINDFDSCLNKHSCFETNNDFRFTTWGSWTECSQTCGVGIQIRTRQCQCKGITCNSCKGKEKDEKVCNIEKCEENANEEIINDCPYSPDSWSPWSHWSVCSQRRRDNDNKQAPQNSSETEVTERVRFGVINNEKNCTITHSKPCKIEEYSSNTFIPNEYCLLPPEQGCSGRYTLLGECANLEKLESLPSPAFTTWEHKPYMAGKRSGRSPVRPVSNEENKVVSKKLGTHPVLCCPWTIRPNDLPSDSRVECNDRYNIGLEGGNSSTWFTCSLGEECVMRDSCPLFKIVKKLSVEKPNLSFKLQSYLKEYKSCGNSGICCPRGPKTSLESERCTKGSVCTYRWKCKEYVEAQARIDTMKRGDQNRQILIQSFRDKVCDKSKDTICCNEVESANRFGLDYPHYLEFDTNDEYVDLDFDNEDAYEYDSIPIQEFQEFNIEEPLEFKFNNTCSNSKEACTDFSSCQDLYLNNSSEISPKVCGWNHNQKVVKVCCEHPQQISTVPVFPIVSGHDCQDKTEMCKSWAEHGACQVGKNFVLREPALTPKKSLIDFFLHRNTFESIEMWDFMTSACSKSCNFCGNKGCRNEHPNCPSWAKQGRCLTNPFFMVHTCRESCGVCGFLSAENKLAQVIHRQDIKDYSNLNGLNFDCGRFGDVKNYRTKRTTNGVLPSQLLSECGLFSVESMGTMQDFKSNVVSCGAMLISDKLAISAAHCVDDWSTSYQHQSRRIKTLSINEFDPEMIEVIQVFRHPQYKYPNLYDDIAILKLGRRFKYDFTANGITPVCMKREPVQGRQLAKLVGRGLTENGERGQFLETEVTIIETDYCKQVLNFNTTNNINARKKIDLTFPKGMDYGIMCGIGIIGEKGIFSGACKGDSGNGLYVEEDGRKNLVGIVSGGIGCGRGYPTWFTRISEYIPWIDCMVSGITNNKRSEIVKQDCRKHFIFLPEVSHQSDLRG